MMNEKSPNSCLGEELERLFRCVLLSRVSLLNQFVSKAKFMPDRRQCGLAPFAGHSYDRLMTGKERMVLEMTVI